MRAVAPVKEDSHTHLSRYRIINQTGLPLFYWAGEGTPMLALHQERKETGASRQMVPF